jgi:hypothetical protein
MDLMRSLQHDAEDVLLGRARGGILVGAQDVKAGGNETEMVARGLLGRRLPKRFRVTNGHLVDSTHARSPQVDVIVVDDAACPVLFNAEDSSEFVPAEAVSAVLEVKASYAKAGLQKWIDDCGVICGLHRQEVPRRIVGQSGPRTKARPPIHRSMLIVDGAGIDIQSAIETLTGTPRQQVPGCVCILKGLVRLPDGETHNEGGVILLRDVEEGASTELGKLVVRPERAGPDARWVFMGFEDECASGANLGLLYGLLVSHLRGSQREVPDLWPYLTLPPGYTTIGPPPS